MAKVIQPIRLPSRNPVTGVPTAPSITSNLKDSTFSKISNLNTTAAATPQPPASTQTAAAQTTTQIAPKATTQTNTGQTQTATGGTGTTGNTPGYFGGVYNQQERTQWQSRLDAINAILDKYYNGRKADDINQGAMIGAPITQFDGTSRDEIKSLRQWEEEKAQIEGRLSASQNFAPYENTFQWLIDNWSDQWGDESVVQPFESQWNDIFKGTIADIQNLPSSTEFLTSFMQNFQIDKIATGEVKPGDYGYTMWKPEYLKKLLEDPKNIPSELDDKPGEPDVSQEKGFMGMLMDAARSMIPNLGKLNIDTDDPLLTAAEKKRFAGALQLMEHPGMTTEEYEQRVKATMAPIREQAEASRKNQLSAIGNKLMGSSTIGPSFSRRIDHELESTESVVRGNLLAEDMKMRQENFQLGLSALADFQKDKQAAIFEKMGLQNQQTQQVLSFLSSVGNTIAGRISDEQQNYVNRLQLAQGFFSDNADRLLQEKLGLAGLELQNYNIDSDAALKTMLNDYEVALRNRGMNSDEAKANAQNLLDQYQLSLSFGKMDVDRLSTIADLAAKAQSGDREAWATYNGLVLEETLKNRGMNNDQADSIAQLVTMMYTMDRNEAMQKWSQLNAQRFAMWEKQFDKESKGGFWSTVGSIVGMGANAAATYFSGGGTGDSGVGSDGSTGGHND